MPIISLILAFITRFLPIIRVLGVLLAFFSYTGFLVHKGVVLQQTKQQKAELKITKTAAKIEAKNDGLSCAEVHKRLEKYRRE